MCDGTITSFCAAHSWATPTASCSRGTMNNFRSGVRRDRESRRTPKPVPVSRDLLWARDTLTIPCWYTLVFL